MNEKRIEILLDNPRITAIALNESFKDFINAVHFAVNKVNFVFKSFHILIIKALEDIAFCRNVKRNLGICLPVGAGKSLIVEYFIAWTFCRNINLAYVYSSHSSTNINKLSREVKDLIEHEFLLKIYNLKLKDDERSKINWSFEGAINRTGLVATTTCSGSTGADSGHPGVEGYSGALIGDDLIDAGDISSITKLQEVIKMYDEKLSTRRRTPTTPSIIIMQRLKKHTKEEPGDLIGWLKLNEPEDWYFIEIPALNEDGTSFYPERYPVKDLEKIREVNPHKFNSQYQQDPIKAGGNVIKRDWFKFYDFDIYQKRFLRLFITTDTGQKIKASNDYTVFAVWGLLDNGLYLLDLLRGKWLAPDLRREGQKFWNQWKNGINNQPCSGFYVEDKVSGTGLIQELERKGIPMIPIPRGGKGSDKVTRLDGVLDYIYSGRVHLPENRVFISDFLAECEAFKRDDSHKHDDQVDVLIDAIYIGLLNNEDIVYDEADNTNNLDSKYDW